VSKSVTKQGFPYDQTNIKVKKYVEALDLEEPGKRVVETIHGAAAAADHFQVFNWILARGKGAQLQTDGSVKGKSHEWPFIIVPGHT